MPFPKPVWNPSLIVILKSRQKLGCCQFVLYSCLLENVCDANELCNVYRYLLNNLLSATGSSPDEALNDFFPVSSIGGDKSLEGGVLTLASE